MSDEYLRHLPEDADEMTKEAFQVLMFVALAQGAETVGRCWILEQLTPVDEYREVILSDPKIDLISEALRQALNSHTYFERHASTKDDGLS